MEMQMKIDNNQIELTDAELQQATGGTGIGIGFLTSSVGIPGITSSASGTFLGYGQGDHFGFGFANGKSLTSSFSGTFPLGGSFNTGLSYSGGQAFGFGY
jgi:hypothetical protein